MKITLPTDSAERKNVPLFSGVLKYAPAALAGMARISKQGNDKHNPGQPLHHARGKSNDHPDCIVRHAVDVADIEAYIVRNFDNDPEVWCKSEDVQALLTEASQLAWRALMWSQELHEKYGGAPLAPGAKLPSQAEQAEQADINKMTSSKWLTTRFAANDFHSKFCNNCGLAWQKHQASKLQFCPTDKE
jgi:hypothetical protein